MPALFIVRCLKCEIIDRYVSLFFEICVVFQSRKRYSVDTSMVVCTMYCTVLNLWFFGRTVAHELKTCLVSCIQLENGKRYSVDIDIVVCTLQDVNTQYLYLNLSRLKKI